MRNWILASATLAVIFAAGCGEPSREEYVEDIAGVGCDRFDECGEIGPGLRHESMAECRSSLESTFYDLWPANQCGSGQINETIYDSCVERANNFPCDSGFFDQVGFAADCGAGDVCIDPSE